VRPSFQGERAGSVPGKVWTGTCGATGSENEDRVSSCSTLRTGQIVEVRRAFELADGRRRRKRKEESGVRAGSMFARTPGQPWR